MSAKKSADQNLPTMIATTSTRYRLTADAVDTARRAASAIEQFDSGTETRRPAHHVSDPHCIWNKPLWVADGLDLSRRAHDAAHAAHLHLGYTQQPQHAPSAESLVLTSYLTLSYHTTPYLPALEQRHTNPLRRHGRLNLSIRRTHTRLMTTMTMTSITRSAHRTGLYFVRFGVSLLFGSVLQSPFPFG